MSFFSRKRPFDYTCPMHADIERILIPQEKIAARVRELARTIVADHSPPKMSTGEAGEAGEAGGAVAAAEITIVPILTGAMIFCCDLIRHIPFPMKIGLMTVSSYPGASIRTQGSQLLGQQLGDVKGRHVLLIDDILDSGGTIKLVAPFVKSLGAATVKTCVFLRKNRPQAMETPVEYVGFDIPDEFVVGYGLDYNNYYRNLPDVVTLRREAIERGGAVR